MESNQRMHFSMSHDLEEGGKLFRSGTNTQILRYLHFCGPTARKLEACSKLSTFVTARMTRKAFVKSYLKMFVPTKKRKFCRSTCEACSSQKISDKSKFFRFRRYRYRNDPRESLIISQFFVENRKFCRSTCLGPNF